MDDLISRQAAIDTAKRLHDVALANWKETKISANTMIDALKDLPSVQPERKKGKWIEATADGIITFDKNAYAECSVCGKKEFLGWRKNFCPNCGADMRGNNNVDNN